jgi:hypothetical protein
MIVYKKTMERLFLLDRSGSMESCRADTISGMNAFIDSQRELGGTLTLCLFDHEVETVYENVPIETAPHLTMETFVPRGGTALYDAMGQVLKMNLAENAMVIILTDGEENSSQVYSAAHVKDLVEMKKWQFVYLGANQDAVFNASKLGITVSHNYDVTRTPDVFRTVSGLASQYSQAAGYP